MDNLLQIKMTEILKGLSREYRLFQISDVHLSYINENSSLLDVEDNRRFHLQWDSLKREFAKNGNSTIDTTKVIFSKRFVISDFEICKRIQ